MEKKLKILLVPTCHYDFCAATITEGLYLLSQRKNIEFFTTEHANYGNIENLKYFKDGDEAINYGRDADLVIMTSYAGVKEEIVQKIDNKNKTVYIDGTDEERYYKIPNEFAIYFKREKKTNKIHDANVRSFQFATEERYFFKNKKEIEENISNKKTNVVCMFGQTDSRKADRYWIEETVNNMNIENSVIGRVYDNNPIRKDLDSGKRDHYSYYENLYNAKISIDGYGADQSNSARFWESLANGCCLVCQDPNIIDIPYSFKDKKDFYSFKDVEELKDVINFLLKNDDIRIKTAKNSYKKLLEYHTSDKRAEYLINTCKEFGIIDYVG